MHWAFRIGLDASGLKSEYPDRAMTRQTSLLFAVVLIAAPADATAEKPPVHPFESRADLTPEGRIHELVFDRLKQLGIQPANVCSDEVFVRRVYLDCIGTLPTAQEAREFLLDRDPNKRRQLVDRLLEREEFADSCPLRVPDISTVRRFRASRRAVLRAWPLHHLSVRPSRTEAGRSGLDRAVRRDQGRSGQRVGFRRVRVRFSQWY